MDTIFRAVARLDSAGAPQGSQQAPEPRDPNDPDDTAVEAGASGEVLDAVVGGALAVPGLSRYSTAPFSLDELRLEKLLAPAAAEGCYEELVANFHSRPDTAVLKTILFVGTGQGEGCSTTAFNFAVTLSRNPLTPVLYIDADFRTPRAPHDPDARFAPSLANLGMPGNEGLLPVAAVRNAENLFVIPSGETAMAPLTLFRSPAFDAFMAEMSSYFAHIIIDAPPLQDAPESLLLAGKSDGVILVLDCERSRRKVAARLAEKIRSNGGKIIGTVLNRRRYFIPDWLYRIL